MATNITMPRPDDVSIAATGRAEFNVNTLTFGNGYVQTSPNGINNKLLTWTAVWEYLSVAERDSVMADLDSTEGAGTITWQAPGETIAKIFLVKSYTIDPMSGNIFAITAQLKEIY